MPSWSEIRRASAVDVEGVGLAAVSESDVVDHVLGELASGRGGWVSSVNIDVLRQCAIDLRLRALVNSADLTVADGTPIVWLTRLRGTPVPERVAGSSLISALPAHLVAARRSLFLLGGNPGIADHAAAEFQRRHPALRVVGTHCPPLGFESQPQELEAVQSALTAARPDVVYVGLGFPKQDWLIEVLRPVFASTWFISCGISLSFIAGEVRRAPRWAQVAGLEWVFRIREEPRRLFGRYIRDDLPFAARLFASAAASRVARRASVQSRA